MSHAFLKMVTGFMCHSSLLYLYLSIYLSIYITLCLSLYGAGVVNFVDARTKWFDDMLSKAITNHGIKQVVVVAAGFDTRSYR